MVATVSTIMCGYTGMTCSSPRTDATTIDRYAMTVPRDRRGTAASAAVDEDEADEEVEEEVVADLAVEALDAFVLISVWKEVKIERGSMDGEVSAGLRYHCTALHWSRGG